MRHISNHQLGVCLAFGSYYMHACPVTFATFELMSSNAYVCSRGFREIIRMPEEIMKIMHRVSQQIKQTNQNLAIYIYRSYSNTHFSFVSHPRCCVLLFLMAVKMRKLASGDELLQFHNVLTEFSLFNTLCTLLVDRWTLAEAALPRLWSTEYCFCKRSRRSCVLTIGWHSQASEFCRRNAKLDGRVHDILSAFPAIPVNWVQRNQ